MPGTSAMTPARRAVPQSLACCSIGVSCQSSTACEACRGKSLADALTDCRHCEGIDKQSTPLHKVCETSVAAPSTAPGAVERVCGKEARLCEKPTASRRAKLAERFVASQAHCH